MILNIPQNSTIQFEMIPLSKMEHRKEAHRHDFYVLVYVQKGKGLLSIDYEEIDIVSNRIHLLSPQQVHLWDGSCEGYSIIIYPDYLSNETKLLEQLFMNFNQNNYLDIPSDMQKEFSMLLSLLAQKYKTTSPLNPTVRSLLSSFLYYCLEIKNQKKQLKSIEYNNYIISIFKLIEKNFKENLSVNEYAKILQLSPQHLNRILKQKTGKSLIQIIRERIIIEVKRELVFSNNSIDVIGEALGYFDSSNFSKFFKKQTDLSPSDFRKKFKNYH